MKKQESPGYIRGEQVNCDGGNPGSAWRAAVSDVRSRLTARNRLARKGKPTVSVCVTRGEDWVDKCRVAQSLTPGLCDHGCPFVPDEVTLEQGGGPDPGNGGRSVRESPRSVGAVRGARRDAGRGLTESPRVA